MDASIAWVPPTRAAAVSVCAVAQRRLSPGVDCGSLLHGGACAWHPKFVGALFLLFLRSRYLFLSYPLLFLHSRARREGAGGRCSAAASRTKGEGKARRETGCPRSQAERVSSLRRNRGLVRLAPVGFVRRPARRIME